MLVLAFAVLLAAAPAEQQAAPPPGAIPIDPLVVEAYRKTPPPIPSTQEVVNQLNRLVKEQPDRVVCLRKAPLGTRIPKNYCATLRKWYDFQADRDVDKFLAANSSGGGGPGGVNSGPPYELVDVIRARYRDPKSRAQAEARARLRAAAEVEAARGTSSSTTPNP